MSEEEVLDEDILQQIYTWIDVVPLSRPKKNISRDFSDGVLVAEIIHHFIPKIIDLHNYSTAHATAKKMDNWNVLSRKCFNKLSFTVKDSLIKGAVFAEPGAIELILRNLQTSIENYMAKKKAQAMLENNEMHDEISLSSSDGYSTEQLNQFIAQGYGIPSDLGYPTQQMHEDPYGNPNYGAQQQYHHQQQYFASQQNNCGIQYQYQSPPHSLNDLRKQKTPDQNPSAILPNTNKNRKPVTQVTKYSKSKMSVGSRNATDDRDVSILRLTLEEKEQALLASQETVQILYAKIRRLEHLLQLKDLRLNEVKQQQQQHHVLPSHIQYNPPPPSSISPQSYRHPLPHHGLQNAFPLPRPPLPQIPRPPGEDLKSRVHR